MARTNIDWADQVWNPVRGCNINCKAPDGSSYCYAKICAPRSNDLVYSKELEYLESIGNQFDEIGNFDLYKGLKEFRPVELTYAWDKRFPFRSAVFVNSMSDISCWDDEWINKLSLAMFINSGTNTFISLTKDYSFCDLRIHGETKDHSATGTYLGYTVTTNSDIIRLKAAHPVFTANQFINVEPLLEPLTAGSIEFLTTIPAVIIGAETGNRKGKADIESACEWVMQVAFDIENYCDDREIPSPRVFVKEPAFSWIIEDQCIPSRHDALCFRQLLWTTRKAVI